MNANYTTRIAQPPGGRTSFSFSDGSDYRRMPVSFGVPQRHGVTCSQPPGGRSSFIFDDTISRGSTEQRRYSNGVLRRDGFDTTSSHPSMPSHRFTQPTSPQPLQQPIQPTQPPGGRSSFVLSDGSDEGGGPVVSRQRIAGGDDALSAFVTERREPPPRPKALDLPLGAMSVAEGSLGFGAHRARLAPPGGHASFSLGWGCDKSVNVHEHAGRLPARTSAYELNVPRCGADVAPRPFDIGVRGAAFDATATSSTKAPYAPAPYVATHTPGRGFDLHAGSSFSSTRICAPPGGHSSITFG
jgi:hypothetical protein